LNRSFSLMFSLSTSMEFFFYFDLKITEWKKQSLLFCVCFLIVLLIKVFYFWIKYILILVNVLNFIFFLYKIF
jgi:hypothetical protein